MSTSVPLPAALLALARCALATASLLAHRRVHLPTGRRDTVVRLPNGSATRIYRETVVDRGPAAEPCGLVVTFRLRGVRGLGHVLFRRESILSVTTVQVRRQAPGSCVTPPSASLATRHGVRDGLDRVRIG